MRTFLLKTIPRPIGALPRTGTFGGGNILLRQSLQDDEFRIILWSSKRLAGRAAIPVQGTLPFDKVLVRVAVKTRQHVARLLW